MPYLRWRYLPLGPAVTTGLITRSGREVLAGRIVFPELRSGRPIWMSGRVLESPDGEPVVARPALPGFAGCQTAPWLGRCYPRHARGVRGGRPDGPARSPHVGCAGLGLAGNAIRGDMLIQLNRFRRLYLALDPDKGGLRAPSGWLPTLVRLPFPSVCRRQDAGGAREIPRWRSSVPCSHAECRGVLPIAGAKLRRRRTRSRTRFRW